MSFRNRSVLNRKHRPRWQDELRSQQLIVAGFAVAIALALGIFGATVWNSYYDAHLRQIALVGDASLDRDALGTRQRAMAAELNAKGVDLQSQQGGARDAVIKQQLDVVSGQLQTLASDATTSLVDGTFMRERAAAAGISVSDAEIDAEVKARQDLPRRLKLLSISISALPADAKGGTTPTDAQWSAAQKEANDVLAQLRAGGDFAALAKAHSNDAATKDNGGLIGWVQAADATYGKQFDAAKAAKVGDLVGPVKTDAGYQILRVDDERKGGSDPVFKSLLTGAGIGEDAYRSYIHDELLRRKFTDYFGASVVKANQPQRKIAQILIAPDDQGVPVPKLHLRHILVQPLPGASDQSKATPAQWAAALEKAKKIRVEAAKPDADWYALAKQSDDQANATRAGDLGWYDPATSTFVKEFKDAVRTLRVGQVSQPVKTSFGYHIIKVVGERLRAADQAEQLITQLKKDPGSFAALARDNSEDSGTAAKGGEVGWVAHYELPAEQDQAVFALTKKDQISDPVVTSTGTYIYKLLDSSDSMPVSDARQAQIKQNGFPRWLDEQKKSANIWVDPQYASTSSSTASSGSGVSTGG